MDENKTTVMVGPPGTGKTYRLLNEVEWFMNEGSKPNKIGFVSFTNKAADEGRERAAAKFGIPIDEFCHFRTIHSMAFRNLGMRRDQVLSWKHLHELGRMLGLEFKGRSQIEEGDVYGMASADRMLFMEGFAKATKKPLRTVWEDANEDEISWDELERFSRALDSFKKSRGLRDFNDMLEEFAAAPVQTYPKLDALFIDEAQDLSALQWDCIEKLAHNAGSTWISGDDRQAIFQWSGADVQAFINLKGQQRNLSQSYRVPKAIHEIAESISARISVKRPATWNPREATGEVAWHNSHEEVDLSSGTWLLLARNGYMLEALEEYCAQEGFSYHSISRDPLKSKSLRALKVWENLRRGNSEPVGDVIEMLRLGPGYVTAIVQKLKSIDPATMVEVKYLVDLGLREQPPWFDFLVRISAKESDFFRAVLRRKESLFKVPRIKISTIHSAKGGEAENVLLMTDISYRCRQNMEVDYDSECRVFYVGCTRASQSLHLISPNTSQYFDL